MDKKKILVVDDNEILLKILDKQLSSAGFSVAKATNGRDAISTAKNRCPDLIILDVMMPEMDGVETARVLERDLSTKNIPIIFLTALLTKKEEREGKILLGWKCLAKPLDTEELLRTIKEYL